MANFFERITQQKHNLADPLNIAFLCGLLLLAVGYLIGYMLCFALAERGLPLLALSPLQAAFMYGLPVLGYRLIAKRRTRYKNYLAFLAVLAGINTVSLLNNSIPSPYPLMIGCAVLAYLFLAAMALWARRGKARLFAAPPDAQA